MEDDVALSTHLDTWSDNKSPLLIGHCPNARSVSHHRQDTELFLAATLLLGARVQSGATSVQTTRRASEFVAGNLALDNEPNVLYFVRVPRWHLARTKLSNVTISSVTISNVTIRSNPLPFGKT